MPRAHQTLLPKLIAPLLAALLATSLPSTALADPESTLDRAKSLFSAGAEAYGAGKYPVAIQAFDEAYKLAPKPNILFSLAQAERKQFYIDKQPDRLHKALQHYRLYLDQVASGGRRADAADAVEELEPIASKLSAGPPVAARAPETRLMVTCKTPKATGTLDGTTTSEMPLMEEVKPGAHKVRVSTPGFYDEERELVAVSGTIVTLDLPLRERPARVAIEAPGGADLYVDGRLVGETPLAHDLELAAGSHLFALTRNGSRAWTRTVTLARGEKQTLSVRFLQSSQRTTSFWIMGGGLLAGATGGVFVALALNDESKAKSIYAASKVGGLGADQLGVYSSTVASRDQLRTASLISFGTGVVLLGIGGALFLFDHPSPAAASPSDAPAPAPTGPSIAAAPLFAPGLYGAGITGVF